MDWSALYAIVSSLWVVWFMVLFTGIVVWALWPTRRQTLEAHGEIPLKDGE